MTSSTPTLAARLLRRLERFAMGRRAYKWVLRDWLPAGDLAAARDVLGTMRFSGRIEPQLSEGPVAEEIVVIAPHPDDEVIGPGGTLIRAARAGCRITVVFVTSGNSHDAGMRESESQACAAKCGFEARFLRAAERAIDVSAAARGIAEVIEEKRPGAIFIPFLLDDHDDHRRVNESLLQAAVAGLQTRPEVWAYQVYTPLPGNIAVDITDVAEHKAEAIRSYASQMQRRDWAHFALGLNAFNCRFLPPGRKGGYAECFFVVPMPDYIELCRRYFGSGQVYCEPAYVRQ
jgi:LmbE family N-acetylglucosaminyl deacetylase